jgi:peptidase E
MTDGHAADDGVALHYIDQKLTRVMSSRPRAGGYRVQRAAHDAVEKRLRASHLGRR